MKKELHFHEIINHLIQDINEVKRKSNSIHTAGNIKTSGDEIENLIREKISLFLPERYLVKQGHVVNSEGKVSNQLDIIIFDRLSTPKFFESKNETVFFPIESVLAVGEIKKTLRSNDLIEFGKKIKFLKIDMKRKLIKNSGYGGVTGSTVIADLVTMTNKRKYKNPLFSFIFAIDEEGVENLTIDDSNENMPNDIYILNWGFYLYGKVENERVVPQIEDEDAPFQSLIEVQKPGILCLATMFNRLIEHLNRCHIDPFSLGGYMTDKDIFTIKDSEIKAYNLQSQPPSS
jgi:hypothetical protein